MHARKDPGLHFSCVRWEQFSPEMESVGPGTFQQGEALWALLLSLPGQHSLYNVGGWLGHLSDASPWKAQWCAQLPLP